MFKYLLRSGILLFTLTACSALDLIKPNPGIAVDAQVGDKQQEVAVGQVERTQIGEVGGDSTINKYRSQNPVQGQEIGVVNQVSSSTGVLIVVGIFWLLSAAGFMWFLWQVIKWKKGNPK